MTIPFLDINHFSAFIIFNKINICGHKPSSQIFISYDNSYHIDVKDDNNNNVTGEDNYYYYYYYHVPLF
jgi:hypothetical protein